MSDVGAQPGVTVGGVPERTLEALADRLDLRGQVRLLTAADAWSLHAEPEVGLRRVVLSDGPVGVRGERWDERDHSVALPSPTCLAAGWDPARVRRLGRLLASEARAKHVDVLLAPMLNLPRTPLAGRQFECLGEDPLLSGVLAAALVQGVQSQGVGAALKHLVANDSETDRFGYDVQADERTLRERYLAAFEHVVRQARPWVVMAAHNCVGGTPMTEHPLLERVLKEEWGFDGVVLSDPTAVRDAEAAARAGLDLLVPGPDGPWGEALEEAVGSGRVEPGRVRDKALRLLRLAGRVGALPGSYAPVPEPWPTERIASELRGAAAAGMVLLRNEGDLLPLRAADLTRVALIGPEAEHGCIMGGGSATVFPSYAVGPLEAMGHRLRADVAHAQGVSGSDRLRPLPVAWLEHEARVRFLAADGTVLAEEARWASTFRWMSTVADGVAVADVDAVEVRLRVRVPDKGRYLVGAGGLGAFTVAVDGDLVLDERVEAPPGTDPVTAVARPPQEVTELDLRPDRVTELHVRHSPERLLGPGGVDLAVVGFQVLLGAQPVADDDLLEEAEQLAASSDVAVVVVGTTAEDECEGVDRATLALPGRQDELVRRVLAANPCTVVVLNAGAPVLLPWADEAPSVLLTWFPGQEFGSALTDVLLGGAEPGGRLPLSWPESEEGLPSTAPVDGVLAYDEGLHVGYRRYEQLGRAPRFGFGHGLGYTTWELGRPEAPGVVGPDGSVTVQVPVRNTGQRSGRQLVQVYASRPDSAVERVPRWLVGFGAAVCAPGSGATVEVAVRARELAHWDVESSTWVVEPGRYVLHVGTSLASATASLELEVR